MTAKADFETAFKAAIGMEARDFVNRADAFALHLNRADYSLRVSFRAAVMEAVEEADADAGLTQLFNFGR